MPTGPRDFFPKGGQVLSVAEAAKALDLARSAVAARIAKGERTVVDEDGTVIVDLGGNVWAHRDAFRKIWSVYIPARNALTWKPPPAVAVLKNKDGFTQIAVAYDGSFKQIVVAALDGDGRVWTYDVGNGDLEPTGWAQLPPKPRPRRS